MPLLQVTTDGGVGNPLIGCRQQITGYLTSQNLTTMAALLQLPNVTYPSSLLDVVYARAGKDPEFDVTLLAPTNAAFMALNGSECRGSTCISCIECHAFASCEVSLLSMWSPCAAFLAFHTGPCNPPRHACGRTECSYLQALPLALTCAKCHIP